MIIEAPCKELRIYEIPTNGGDLYIKWIDDLYFVGSGR